MKDKYLFLPLEYQLVVGDCFQLFYRGIIRLNNPYKYYIHVECLKGNPLPRYYTFTPTTQDIGEYELKITLYDDDHEVIETASTILVVKEVTKPLKKYNILCFGDSLTFNGVWPLEGYRRLCDTLGSTSNILNFIGKCQIKCDNLSVGYEGYGGWTWQAYASSNITTSNSPIWVKFKQHNLDESDQHSKWLSGNLNWKLETIADEVKFVRGDGNNTMIPVIEKEFKHVANAKHQETLIMDSFRFEKGNPFWNSVTNKIDFYEYAKSQQVDNIDYAYILLTWNGQYIPFNHDFSHHEKYMIKIIDQLHEDFPNIKVRLLGIQICSVNGGIGVNYGAHGVYSDTFGTISTAFFYNAFLEEFVKRPQYRSFCKYIDIKGQFDSEYNMPFEMRKVNNRNETLERIGNNGVHPTMNGYMQIGDAFFRSLVHDLK